MSRFLLYSALVLGCTLTAAQAEDSVSWHALSVSMDGFYGAANDMDDEEAAMDAAEEECFAASEQPDTCTTISLMQTADDEVGWMGSMFCDDETVGPMIFVGIGDSSEAAFEAALDSASEFPGEFCEGMYALSTDGEVEEFSISDDPE